jgi:DNA-directed RNA polymerase II subunit RPB3
MARIDKIKNVDEKLTFTLSNVDVSIANGLRRIILSEIPIVGFKTMPYDQNKANIITNTTRFNNEVIKQRLSCIPVCIKNINDENIANYLLEINVENNTDTIIMVTTKDFRIKNISTNKYLDDGLVNEIFPPFKAANGKDYYIDFVRLRPRISDELSGEKIHLTCTFSIVKAKEDSSFNVTGTCSYEFTPDFERIEEEAAKKKQKLKDDGLDSKQIEFQIKNWKILDGKRYVIKNSFNFVIETVGIYENEEIMIKACEILINKLNNFMTLIVEDDSDINESLTTTNNSYDVILKNEDYTLGNIINNELYNRYYIDEKSKILNYVGFKKKHPHDTDSFIRMSFIDNPESKQTVVNLLSDVITHSMEKIMEVKRYFGN